MGNLKDKIAVVTGGNSGMGYATARELKTRGAQVIITGRRAEAVEKAAAELGVTGIVADQSSLTDITSLAEQVSERFGKVDVLFINAGVTAMAPIEFTSEELFDTMVGINYKGAYFTLNKFIPLLNEGASVVFLSSNMASSSGANSSVYSSSKAAINSVMKIAAVELAPRKIRVNSVSPGPTATEIMNKMGLDRETLKAIGEMMIEKIPLKAIGKPEDIARLVTYLCDDAAGFITGADFVIDGGMLLG